MAETRTPVTLTGTIDVAKSDSDERTVYGWAMIAVEKNGEVVTDRQGDRISPAELEKAAAVFTKDFRQTGVDHTGNATGQMVESIVFTKAKQEALGLPEGSLPEGWFVGFQLDTDEDFALVKSGERPAFSIQGTGRRIPVGV